MTIIKLLLLLINRNVKIMNPKTCKKISSPSYSLDEERKKRERVEYILS